MTAKVTVTVHELSPNPVRVSGLSGGEDVILQPTQSRDFDGQNITLKEEATDPNATDMTVGNEDVFSHQNPNGITRAEIGPKLPKAGGETEQKLTDDGRVLETTVQMDPALAVAGGGPKGAETGQTPGPQPSQNAVELTSMGARATGAQSAPAKEVNKAAGADDEDDEDDDKKSSRNTTPSRSGPSTGGASPKK
jgi:hypothetical protein